MALCLGAGELVERSFLTHATLDSVRLAHTIRGIASSVVTAMVVGWSLVSSSPPLLVPISLEPRSAASRATEQARTAHYSQWLIQMRWVVTVFTTAMTVVAAKWTTILPRDVWAPLITTIGLLAATNVFYAARASRGPFRGLLEIQLAADLVILTLLLHFTGGVENPFSVAALFHVVFAGILLPKRECFALALFGALLFAAMAWAEWAGVAQHHALALFPERAETVLYPAREPISVLSHTLVQFSALFLIAYFVTTLADRVRGDERRLELMAERALAERQLLERALDTTGTGLRVCDQEARPEWVNNRWRELFEDSVLAPSAAPVQRTFEDQRVRVTEVAMEAQSSDSAKAGPNASVVYQITTAPIVDAHGKVIQVAELAMDVTRQKHSQAQLIRAGKMAAVGQLAGQVAHEVNNPIAIISGKARLLLSGHRHEMSDGVAVEVEKIVTLADRVADIARGLLSYCRASPAVHSLLDVRLPARHALSMIAERARHSEIEVLDRLAPTPLMVEANAGELEQVFLNLFLNALDAMPDGGRLVLSSTPAALPDGRAGVVLEVEDSGTGISEQLMDQIWEPFFSTKGEGQGTGLGLSISQGLVKSHGGELGVKSVVGQSTTFSIHLPLAATKSDEVAAQ